MDVNALAAAPDDPGNGIALPMLADFPQQCAGRDGNGAGNRSAAGRRLWKNYSVKLRGIPIPGILWWP